MANLDMMPMSNTGSLLMSEGNTLTMMEYEAIENREARYWDGCAAQTTEVDLYEELIIRDEPVCTYFDRRLTLLGDLADRRILDVGCGTGFWSVALAKRGAAMEAIDISPESVAVANRRAAVNGLSQQVHAQVMSAMALDFPDESFDMVHGQDIIHHVDADLLGSEVARVLKPGGSAVFHENCANNPVLMWARDNLCGRFGIPKWSSDDEYPLTREKLAIFAQHFDEVEVHFPRLICFYMVDAKIFKKRSRLVTKLCTLLDDSIYRFFPSQRENSFMQVIRFSNPA